jgi:hypothetical protein
VLGEFHFAKPTLALPEKLDLRLLDDSNPDTLFILKLTASTAMITIVFVTLTSRD